MQHCFSTVNTTVTCLTEYHRFEEINKSNQEKMLQFSSLPMLVNLDYMC